MGLAGLVTETLETAARNWQKISESSIGQWMKPAMHEIEGTEVGVRAAGILRNQFEPEVARTTSFYRNSLKYSPQQATKLAVKDTADKFFGQRGEGLINLMRAIDEQSGHNKIHVNNVADAFDLYFGEKGVTFDNWRSRLREGKEGLKYLSPDSSYKPAGPVEKWSKGVAQWIFLPRIVIPHTTQPLNVLLYNGADAFGKATSAMFEGGLDAAKRRVVQSGVLEDQILFQMLDTAKGGGLARKIFHMPGFNYLREIQITHAALAGEFTAKDAFAEYIANGRELTPKLELMFQRHGIDPRALRGLSELTPEMIKTAQYRAAQATYFMRSGLDVPYPWGQNWMSRMGTLYKNFGYNQARFISEAIHDSFKVSPEEGIKTVSLIATVYPMAGYAVGQVENAINLRPTPVTAREKAELYSQYVDAVGHAAGFGIAYSIFRSAKRNALADYAIGPIPSTVLDFAQDVINAPSSAARRRNLGRDVLRRIPLAGPAITEELLPRKRRRSQ